MIKRRNNQKGLTLLEYCAGAAIIGVVVFAVLKAMGGGMQEAGQNIGNWAKNTTAKMDANIPDLNSPGDKEESPQ